MRQAINYTMATGLALLLPACSYYTFDPERHIRQRTQYPAERYTMKVIDEKSGDNATYDVRVVVNTATFANVKSQGISVIDFIAEHCPQLGRPVGDKHTLLMQYYDNEMTLLGNQFSRHAFYATELATDALLTSDHHHIIKFSEQSPVKCGITFVELHPREAEQASPHYGTQ